MTPVYRRLVAPLLLIVVGVLLLCGCVFIPTFDKTIRGRNVSKYVGPHNSKRPIRLHAATREDVVRLLGKPQYASPDRTRVAYEWDVANGVWIWPFCFAAYEQQGKRALLLTFDEPGVLRTAEILKSNGHFLYPAPGPALNLPRDMRDGFLPATRPVTRPAERSK